MSQMRNATVVVGVESKIAFTACDDEEMPVAHSLSSSMIFAILTTVLDSETSEPTINYLGKGVYEVIIAYLPRKGSARSGHSMAYLWQGSLRGDPAAASCPCGSHWGCGWREVESAFV